MDNQAKEMVGRSDDGVSRETLEDLPSTPAKSDASKKPLADRLSLNEIDLAGDNKLCWAAGIEIALDLSGADRRAGYGVYFGPSHPLNAMGPVLGPQTQANGDLHSLACSVGVLLREGLVGDKAHMIATASPSAVDKLDQIYTKGPPTSYKRRWERRRAAQGRDAQPQAGEGSEEKSETKEAEDNPRNDGGPQPTIIDFVMLESSDKKLPGYVEAEKLALYGALSKIDQRMMPFIMDD